VRNLIPSQRVPLKGNSEGALTPPNHKLIARTDCAMSSPSQPSPPSSPPNVPEVSFIRVFFPQPQPSLTRNVRQSNVWALILPLGMCFGLVISYLPQVSCLLIRLEPSLMDVASPYHQVQVIRGLLSSQSTAIMCKDHTDKISGTSYWVLPHPLPGCSTC
jgi:hypothetical protein